MQRNVQRTAAERDQALSDLAALRDSLMQQQEDNARRVSVLGSERFFVHWKFFLLLGALHHFPSYPSPPASRVPGKAG